MKSPKDFSKEIQSVMLGAGWDQEQGEDVTEDVAEIIQERDAEARREAFAEAVDEIRRYVPRLPSILAPADVVDVLAALLEKVRDSPP